MLTHGSGVGVPKIRYMFLSPFVSHTVGSILYMLFCTLFFLLTFLKDQYKKNFLSLFFFF